MKVVYVSGPYTGHTVWETKQNIDRAAEITAKLWQIPGVVPICPHLNSAFMDGVTTRHKFLEGDFELVRRSDAILMIGPWGTSKGALEELAVARDNGKRIFFNYDDTIADRIREWAGEGL